MTRKARVFRLANSSLRASSLLPDMPWLSGVAVGHSNRLGVVASWPRAGPGAAQSMQETFVRTATTSPVRMRAFLSRCHFLQDSRGRRFYLLEAFGFSLPSTTKPRYLTVTARVQETFTVCSPG